MTVSSSHFMVAARASFGVTGCDDDEKEEDGEEVAAAAAAAEVENEDDDDDDNDDDDGWSPSPPHRPLAPVEKEKAAAPFATTLDRR